MNLLGIIRQERYRKRLTPLPFFFTFGNACLGFLAIVKSLEGDYTSAVYCIIAAAFMDVFDGRLARALGTTSMIGVELDSLVDGISFCLAPAVIFYTAYPYDLNIVQFTILLTYVCAGLYRLAKFNAHSSTPSKAYFSGMPTPMAAFCVISLVLHRTWFTHISFPHHFLFIAIALIAVLMVSPIPFKKHSALSRKELTVLIPLISVGSILSAWYAYPWLLIGMISYILATCTLHGYTLLCEHSR